MITTLIINMMMIMMLMIVEQYRSTPPQAACMFHNLSAGGLAGAKPHTFLTDSQSVKKLNDPHTINSPTEQKDKEWTHSKDRSEENHERVAFFDLRKPPGRPEPEMKPATTKPTIGIDHFRRPEFFTEIRPREPW